MRETILRSVFVLLACAALASAVIGQTAPQTAEAEVEQASDHFWATQARGDAAALAEQFTETGILMLPGLADAEGRTAVRDLLQQRFADLRIAEFKVHRREMRVTGDSAYELGWFSATHHHEDAGSMRMEGRYLLVWNRSEGVWRVHRYFYNFSAATPLSE